MKIIEAMKRIKANKEKIDDLQAKINKYSAHMSYETPLYGADTATKIREWAQSAHDTVLDNIKLLTAIQRTNLATMVTITLGGKTITKNIAEWVWRKREYAAKDLATWSAMNDRNLKDQMAPPTTPGGEPTKLSVVRYYDPVVRDEMLAVYRSEGHEIDAALEIINATTELVE